LGFVRWVVPIKARGRYTLCSAIHRAEGVRRVRNGDFWKSELFAKDLPTECCFACLKTDTSSFQGWNNDCL
jgi:hypothetical protein